MDILILLFKLFLSSTITYFIVAGILFFIVYKLLEKKLERNKIQRRGYKNSDIIREISHSIQSNIFLATMHFICLFTPLAKYTQVYKNINDYPIWYVPISIILLMLLHDTYFYFMHRIVHNKSLFNIIHLVHHKSIAPTPWAAYSFQLLEGFTEALAIPILLFLIPVHPIIFAIYVIIALLINVYGHLGYEVMPKKFRNSILFEILGTSVYHNLHHSKFNYNYSLYFRHWDKFFRTEYPQYEQEYDKIQSQRFNE
jgi:lathosterol oxidase